MNDNIPHEGSDIPNSHTGWISVKDRLPDTESSILVAFKWFDKPIEVRQMTYYSEDHWHRSDMFVSPEGAFHRLETITHWMPLPKPPTV
jgi:hypothetical protein